MKKLILFLLLGLSAFAQPTPVQVVEATAAQVAAGTAGAPYYVSPRRLASGGGAGVFSSLTDTSLSAGRVVYTGTGGLLSVSANLAYTDGTTTGQLIHPVGAAATPSMTFLGDTNTGFFWSSADAIGVAIGGNNLFTFYTGGSVSARLGSSQSSAYLEYPTTGAINLVGAGTNQNITLTPSGTGAVVLPSTITSGLQLYNTADQVAHYERLGIFASSNIWNIASQAGGSGTNRAILIGTGAGRQLLVANSAATNGVFQFDYASSSSTSSRLATFGTSGGGSTNTATSGTMAFVAIQPTYNQASGTAANTDLLINRTNTAVGSGAQKFIDMQIGGTSTMFLDYGGSGSTGRLQSASSLTLYAAGSLFLTSNNSLALTLGSSQEATFSGAIIGGVQALSGAGAVNVTQLNTDYTSTGGAQALTLANGTAGQIKTICHVTDGGSGVLTPTTKTGFTTITFTNAGDSVTLRYSATGGWYIIGIFGAVAA